MSEELAELCNETAAACKRCADFCLAKPNVKPFESVITTARDTAVFLWVLGTLLKCKSPFIGSFSLYCADACLCTAEAGENCDEIQIKECALLCRKCAHAARKMADTFINQRLTSFGN